MKITEKHLIGIKCLTCEMPCNQKCYDETADEIDKQGKKNVGKSQQWQDRADKTRIRTD